MSVVPSPESDRRYHVEWYRQRQARASTWHQLRRREVIIEVSDYIMRLRHAGRDAERWLDRLARLCGTTRPEWAARPTRADARAQAPPSSIALARRHNKALRRRGHIPVDATGRDA